MEIGSLIIHIHDQLFYYIAMPQRLSSLQHNSHEIWTLYWTCSIFGLSNNQLSGKIPSSTQQLIMLEVLKVKVNSLKGHMISSGFCSVFQQADYINKNSFWLTTVRSTSSVKIAEPRVAQNTKPKCSSITVSTTIKIFISYWVQTSLCKGLSHHDPSLVLSWLITFCWLGP